ncbi:hypothetical protein B0J13DRAFT_600656 [Dactylonectria estremocensis]|uniref:Transmembrane protein n=1 Tax=Dactylonectria estremocensis TaxID=1079267 RepID=A0A9P9CYI2_9HYPO|nr:hypothetical protein B0J13DRAFT_600656 [Dactylonectria estremocensis]
MSNLLHSAIALGLWTIQGSYGRVLSESTERPHMADRDRPPVQTHMIEVPELKHMAKRQQTSLSNEVFAVTIATDETCGWLSGSAGNPISCENHQSCMWVGSLGIICGVLEDSKNWEVHVRCVERKVALNTSLCNDTCASNIFYLRCTDVSAAYCRTYAYPEGIQDYRCAPTPVARAQSVSFTYDGQIDAKFLTSTFTVINSLISSTEPVSSTVPPPASPPPPNHVNVGAIVGAVIGGCVAVSLMALTIFWFVRRRKTRPVQQVTPSMLVDPMEQVPPTGTGPNDGKPGLNSHVPSEWRDSMMTMLGSGSNPASPQHWMVQPVSPGGQSVASQGVPQSETHEMSRGTHTVTPQGKRLSIDCITSNQLGVPAAL